MGRICGASAAVPAWDLTSNVTDSSVLQCYPGGKKNNCSTEKSSHTFICLTKIHYSLLTPHRIYGGQIRNMQKSERTNINIYYVLAHTILAYEVCTWCPSAQRHRTHVMSTATPGPGEKVWGRFRGGRASWCQNQFAGPFISLAEGAWISGQHCAFYICHDMM